MNTTGNNKLIAEFMGLKPYDDNYIKLIKKDNEIHVSNLKYHISWDWLIPVVGKCFMMNEEKYQTDISFSLWQSKMDMYESVVEFIKWYNNR